VTRRYLATVAGGLLVAGIAGFLSCAPARQEIVFWQFWPVEVVQPLLDRFEHENPGLHVRLEQLAWQGGLEKINAAIAAGDVPDLCELGSTWMPRMLESGQLVD
jgi:multiple sugar transport system substrate-binding protein